MLHEVSRCYRRKTFAWSAAYVLKEYTERLRSGPVNKFIRGFLDNVPLGPEKISEWWDQTGRHVKIPAHPSGRSFFAIKGIRKMAGNLIGVWGAIATYNNLRAEGVDIPKSLTSAGLDLCNPIPLGPQEFYDTQKAWFAFNDRVRARNRSWSEQLFGVLDGGDIPKDANGAVPQEWKPY